MLPLAIVFLFWLALHNRVSTYAAFATTAAPGSIAATGLGSIANTPLPGSPGGLNAYGGRTSKSPAPAGTGVVNSILRFFGLNGLANSGSQ